MGRPLGSQPVIGNVVMVKSRHAKSRLPDAMDLLLKFNQNVPMLTHVPTTPLIASIQNKLYKLIDTVCTAISSADQHNWLAGSLLILVHARNRMTQLVSSALSHALWLVSKPIPLQPNQTCKRINVLEKQQKITQNQSMATTWIFWMRVPSPQKA